jgi:hypothetical protein
VKTAAAFLRADPESAKKVPAPQNAGKVRGGENSEKVHAFIMDRKYEKTINDFSIRCECFLNKP